jgi:GNAT superfamily N-acetyltransferase
MHGLTLRRASAADAGVLALLCQQHAAYERLPYQADGHAGRLAQALDGARLHAWLLEGDDAALGYAAVTLDIATLSGQPFAHLDCLYLVPAARAQGWGERLMAAVRSFAIEHGCAELQWQTPDWNVQAIRFYDRSGARRLSKQRFILSLPF